MPKSHTFLKSKSGRKLFTHFLNHSREYGDLKNLWMLYKNIKKFKTLEERLLLSRAHIIYMKYLKSENESYCFVGHLDDKLMNELGQTLNGKDGDGLGDVDHTIFDIFLPIIIEKLSPAVEALEKSPIENDIISKNGSKNKRKYERDNIKTWDVDDVVKWLDKIGLPMFGIAAKNHEINGEDLLELSRSELSRELKLSDSDITIFKKNLRKIRKCRDLKK